MNSFVLFALNLTPLPRVGVGDDNSPVQIVLNFLLALAAAVCLLIITIAGFRFVLSRGDPQSISKAKNSIIYAAIGLVIVATAGLIVGFVFSNL